MNLNEKLEAQMFSDDEVRGLLAEMPVPALRARLGAPSQRVVFSRPMPEAKPSLASDDPAVVQAMGRCAVARMRTVFVLSTFDRLHPTPCSWCEYPTIELVKACEWGDWQSRFVVADVLVWRGSEGSTYEREGPSLGYSNPAWRDFWALPIHERERRIEAVS